MHLSSVVQSSFQEQKIEIKLLVEVADAICRVRMGHVGVLARRPKRDSALSSTESSFVMNI